jgi:sec-independent protein translocase protein TatA
MQLLQVLLFIGMQEWVIILILALLLFGGKKIPDLMKGLGSGIREFNNAKKDVKQKIQEGINEQPEKSATDTKND